MKLGLVSTYYVKKETKLGYTIYDDEGEYFLHHNECMGNYFKEGDKVIAFLYSDKQKRIAATCAIPKITIEQGSICDVINRTPVGAYIQIGISRDILLSSDDLPNQMMPNIGDKVCCKLKIKGNQLYIKLLSKNEILSLQNHSKEIEEGTKLKAYVYRITDQGINLFDLDYNVFFVYCKNLRKEYRIGEEVEITVLKKNNSDYTATTLPQKEISMKSDAKIIVEYLENHYGVIPFSEKTDPDVIQRVFKMSKSAFKRALGNLYKENKITIEEDRIILNDYI